MDAMRYQIGQLAAYPAEQWRLALKAFPAPSNRPPHSFWQGQRDQAIAWLQGYGVQVEERCGVVYIGETFVDGSYVR